MHVHKKASAVHHYLDFINESYFIRFSMHEFNDVVIISGNPADDLSFIKQDNFIFLRFL